MILRNIYFSNCWVASGALSFFGEGYWHHDLLRRLVHEFKNVDNCTFVAKTVTLDSRQGNMPLDKHFQPRELKPKCIKIKPFKGIVLNSVGLSNPGTIAILKTGHWQGITQPFFISFMAIGYNLIGRLDETKRFVELLAANLSEFRAPIGLQINISCPNIQHNTQELVNEAIKMLQIASELNIPLDLKANIFLPDRLAQEIDASGLCDILTLSNTIPYGTENLGLDWKRLFGETSPLKKYGYGNGGLSGKPVLPLVLKKIEELRMAGVTMPIKGSGGILKSADVYAMKKAGANAIEIGSVLMLRPWRVKEIVDRANFLFIGQIYK
ncbi:MAG: hypothetical protein WC456_01200 [Patescibacteria group bacterium]